MHKLKRTVTENEARALHRRYCQNEEMLELVFTHCKIVADIAVWAVRENSIELDVDILKTICLLHDIGSYSFMHDSYNRNVYAQHAMLGSKILQNEGFDSLVYSAVETHVLMGVSAEDIRASGMYLPAKDFIPETIYGQLLCFADRFHSKQPVFNSREYFEEKISKLPNQKQKFLAAVERFGEPDLAALAKKYGHSIR